MAFVTPLLLLATVLIASWAMYWMAVRRMAKVAASIPGPPTLPIFGNFFDVRLQNAKTMFEGYINEYGHLLRLWCGPLLAVYVFDPKDVEVVLSSPACSTKPPMAYSMLEVLIGNGLVTLNGADHRRHRKLIMPTLHKEMLHQYQPLMRHAADDLVDKFVTNAATGEVFDATPLCGMAAIDSAFRTIVNADGSLLMDSREHRHAVARNLRSLSEVAMLRLFKPWYLINKLFRFNRNYDEFQQLKGLYDDLILDVMKRKRGAKAERPSDGSSPPRRRRAFLDHLLSTEEGRALSDAELYDELKTMLAASFISSQETMSVLLLMLSLLPDCQAKMQRELDDVMGASNRPVEVSDLDHLEYMDRFIKESLRLYPPVALIGRYCTQDVPLPSGHTLPAGCYPTLSPAFTNYNPKYYPEPQRFDPDRFLPEAVASRPPCSFLSFSAGPRNCIGQRYAMMFFKTNLATLLRRVTILPDPKGPKDVASIPITFGVTSFPRDGARIRVQVRPRQLETEA